MQGVAGGGAPVECDGRNDNYDSIVSDLASLIEHVEASMKPIESAIAREAFPGIEDICRQRCHSGRRHALLREGGCGAEHLRDIEAWNRRLWRVRPPACPFDRSRLTNAR
jgi:hypothetical protein